jgi:hypothetical protein
VAFGSCAAVSVDSCDEKLKIIRLRLAQQPHKPLFIAMAVSNVGPKRQLKNETRHRETQLNLSQNILNCSFRYVLAQPLQVSGLQLFALAGNFMFRLPPA